MTGLLLNFFSINNQGFFSPFEGFKIGSWNFELISLSEDLLLFNLPTWYWNYSNQENELFFWVILIAGIIYFFS